MTTDANVPTNPQDADSPIGPELVIGVVTPVGADTADFVSSIRGQLAEWNYQSSLIRLSDKLESTPPHENEREDSRIQRLIKASRDWCVENDSEYGLAPLAIEHIRAERDLLHVHEGDQSEAPVPVQRRAYIIHSLKRSSEVKCLREVYRSAFILLAYQPSEVQQQKTLESRLRSHVTATSIDLSETARKLIELDSYEGIKHGQEVQDTISLADVFVGEDANPSRGINLLFGNPKLAPTLGEYAMYLADATAVRSLTLSRRVGAVIVRDNSILATGMNETPDVAGETPDIIAGFDASEQLKQELAVRVVEHLAKNGVLQDQDQDNMQPEQAGARYTPLSCYSEWMHCETDASDPAATVRARQRFEEEAARLLKASKLSDITEFQRAVHAEMWAVIDAAKRGIALKGSVVYCNTYPCHLCWKNLVAVGIEKMYYLHPYRKSRASHMYSSSSSQLIEPFCGIAPRVYRRFFERDKPARSAGNVQVEPLNRETAQPNVLYADDPSYLYREVEFMVVSPEDQ